MSNVQPVVPLEQALQLTEAMCARICHDLAGPLGALAGTLELALEGDTEAAALAMELAALLSARLSLLRTAWGGGEAGSQPDAAALQPGLPGADRLRIEAGGLPADLPQSLRRMVAPLLLMAASGLPRGGTITLSGTRAGTRAGTLSGTLSGRSVGFEVGIAGAGAGWPQSLAGCAGAPDLCLPPSGGPRGIAVPLACLSAHRLGLKLEVASATTLLVSAA